MVFHHIPRDVSHLPAIINLTKNAQLPVVISRSRLHLIHPTVRYEFSRPYLLQLTNNVPIERVVTILCVQYL